MPPITAKLLLSKSTSYWLRDALITLSGRDPVDALNDAEALATAMRDRYDNLQSVAEALLQKGV